jgi:hypothetical protein
MMLTAMPLLYIGPGVGAGTVLIVLLVIGLVLFSIGLILWIPIKRFFRRLFGKANK